MSPLAWLLSFLDLEIVRGSHSVVCDLTKGKERKPWTILTLVLVMQYGDERDSWLRWGHTTLVEPGKSPAVGLFRSITVNKGYPPSQKPFYQWAVGQNITNGLKSQLPHFRFVLWTKDSQQEQHEEIENQNKFRLSHFMNDKSWMPGNVKSYKSCASYVK